MLYAGFLDIPTTLTLSIDCIIHCFIVECFTEMILPFFDDCLTGKSNVSVVGMSKNPAYSITKNQV